MSVLSNVDLEKEILKGKNIRIFPLKLSNIKGSTYNLTASRYAWSLGTKRSIVSGRKIIIPANDTALIATKEVIWVSKKICGSYHSKVSIVSTGGGHIGTTLDPTWIGHSIISVHNHSSQPIEIGVNQTFVSIMFYYLNNPTTKQQDNTASQIDHLHQFNLTTGAKSYFDESWKKDSDELLLKVKSDEEYKILSDRNQNPYISKILFFGAFILILIASLWFQTQIDDKESLIYLISVWFTGVGLSGIFVPIILSIYNNLK